MVTDFYQLHSRTAGTQQLHLQKKLKSKPSFNKNYIGNSDDKVCIWKLRDANNELCRYSVFMVTPAVIETRD
jgi:hypothetical protein